MYIEEKRKTEVVGEYDVAVCGGGIAGISAALSAAREGRKTVLFEKQYMLGGLGTAGIVTIFLPLCDGFGRQVSFGLAEELLRLSVSMGAEADYPANWLDGQGSRTEKDPRFEVRYNPQIFAMLAEKQLLDSGVDILYGYSIVGADCRDGRIEYLLTESKSGRTAFRVRAVVDATGDADVAALVGAPTERFRQGNVLAAWYYSLGQAGYRLNMVGAADIPDEEKKATKAAAPLIARRFGGLDGRELSEMMCASHAATMRDLLKKRESDPATMPVTLATTPQIRMTRRIVGARTLAAAEEHTAMPDSIGMVSNWKKRGPVWEVPFSTLYTPAVRNLLFAGRCTSVDETLWDVMRVIPCCAVTGQAAGIAAAMGDDMAALPIGELQARLRARGVVLHEKDL